MTITVVVGGQLGDEGKGRIVAYLSHIDKPEIVVRAGVGPNAGHSVRVVDKTYHIRQVPCGFVNKRSRLLIGAGNLVSSELLLKEISELGVQHRIGIDYRCCVIEDEHVRLDTSDPHLTREIQTTGSGCGPANAARSLRKARLAREVPALQEFLTDVPKELNDAFKKEEDILIEGTQGFGISLYYGSYPYVTSKDTTAASCLADVGIGPTRVDEVIMCLKSFQTRVGAGPLTRELSLEESAQRGILEHGTVTGRPRRVGLFDLEAAKYSAMVNGATQIAMSALDYVDPSCQGSVKYEQLSPLARRFVEEVENALGAPVTLMTTTTTFDHVIDNRKIKCSVFKRNRGFYHRN